MPQLRADGSVHAACDGQRSEPSDDAQRAAILRAACKHAAVQQASMQECRNASMVQQQRARRLLLRCFVASWASSVASLVQRTPAAVRTLPSPRAPARNCSGPASARAKTGACHLSAVGKGHNGSALEGGGGFDTVGPSTTRSSSAAACPRTRAERSRSRRPGRPGSNAPAPARPPASSPSLSTRTAPSSARKCCTCSTAPPPPPPEGTARRRRAFVAVGTRR